jgi:hypothetical protein
MTKALPGLAVSSDPNLPAIEGKIQSADDYACNREDGCRDVRIYDCLHETLIKLLTNYGRENSVRVVQDQMQTSTLEQLKRHLRPGRVYRREDFLPWSQSVDRHLKERMVDGTLQKLRTGLCMRDAI